TSGGAVAALVPARPASGRIAVARSGASQDPSTILVHVLCREDGSPVDDEPVVLQEAERPEEKWTTWSNGGRSGPESPKERELVLTLDRKLTQAEIMGTADGSEAGAGDTDFAPVDASKQGLAEFRVEPGVDYRVLALHRTAELDVPAL